MHTGPESLPNQGPSVPEFIIDDDVPQDQRAELEAIYNTMREDPIGQFIALRRFANNPFLSPQDSIWRRLTEYGSPDSLVGLFYYDRTTRDIIKNDSQHQELLTNRSDDTSANGRKMRVRELTLLLGRLELMASQDQLSLAEAA